MVSYAELRSTDFPYLANCVPPAALAGGFVEGALTGTRHVVGAEALFRAYHECDGVNTEVEAYGTVFQYPAGEYRAHVQRVRSPKGYAGPAACCRLPWDIDSPDLEAALAGARTLARFLLDRYGAHADAGLGAFFSGAKGFHLTLVAMPGFHPFVHVPAVVKLLCLTIARKAGVTVDPAIYDRQRLLRLANTRHPRSGLYKRFLSTEALLRLSPAGIRELARHPSESAVPGVSGDCGRLADDWVEAERSVLAAPIGASGLVRRKPPSCCPVVPEFVRRFIGFAEIQGASRAVALFRCAAALSERGTPSDVVQGLLEEPALKMGLEQWEVNKQIATGGAHGRRPKGGSA